MHRTICRAVVVAADECVRRQLPALLACAEVELVKLCGDAEEAMGAILSSGCDLVVADALLPGVDGAQFLRRMLTLPVRCDGILTFDPLLCGHTDIEGVICLAHPVSVQVLCDAVDHLRSTPPRIDPVCLARAREIFADLGFPDHVGTRCLEYASALCSRDDRWLTRPRRTLNEVLGEVCSCPADHADRAMRHAIEVAWRSDKLENQYRIFGDAIDEKRGWPTCREMIARIADILRLEGCT